MTTFWDLNAALTAAALKTVESADIEELAEIPPSRIKREYAREIRGALGGEMLLYSVIALEMENLVNPDLSEDEAFDRARSKAIADGRRKYADGD